MNPPRIIDNRDHLSIPRFILDDNRERLVPDYAAAGFGEFDAVRSRDGIDIQLTHLNGFSSAGLLNDYPSNHPVHSQIPRLHLLLLISVKELLFPIQYLVYARQILNPT